MLKKVLGVILAAGLIIITLAACSSEPAVKEGPDTKNPEVVSSESKKNSKEASKTGENSEIIEPTELLSKAEAEKLLGVTLKEPQIIETKAVGSKMAFYEAVDEKRREYIQVGISQKSFMAKKTLEGGQSPKSIYESLKKNFPEGTLVEGIGDEAFISPSGLHILEGEYYITIIIQEPDNKEENALLKEAGSIVVEKLK